MKEKLLIFARKKGRGDQETFCGSEVVLSYRRHSFAADCGTIACRVEGPRTSADDGVEKESLM